MYPRQVGRNAFLFVRPQSMAEVFSRVQPAAATTAFLQCGAVASERNKGFENARIVKSFVVSRVII